MGRIFYSEGSGKQNDMADMSGQGTEPAARRYGIYLSFSDERPESNFALGVEFDEFLLDWERTNVPAALSVNGKVYDLEKIVERGKILLAKMGSQQ